MSSRWSTGSQSVGARVGRGLAGSGVANTPRISGTNPRWRATAPPTSGAEVQALARRRAAAVSDRHMPSPVPGPAQRTRLIGCNAGRQPLARPDAHAARGEVVRGGERRVEEVVGVTASIRVPVDRDTTPRRRDELHGTNGTVVHRIVVPRAVVGVADQRHSRATVEGDTSDRPRPYPSSRSRAPPKRPWFDSTRPIAANSHQRSPHDGSVIAVVCSPRT